MTVVRRGNAFLMVSERKHGGVWHLPAGRVDPHESLAEAAVRETFEEAGVPVRLEGILRFERIVEPNGSIRLSVVFQGHPVDGRPPRSKPNREILSAAWITLSQLKDLPLRMNTTWDLLASVADGCPVYPLDVLAEAYRKRGKRR